MVVPSLPQDGLRPTFTVREVLEEVLVLVEVLQQRKDRDRALGGRRGLVPSRWIAALVDLGEEVATDEAEVDRRIDSMKTNFSLLPWKEATSIPRANLISQAVVGDDGLTWPSPSASPNAIQLQLL